MVQGSLSFSGTVDQAYTGFPFGLVTQDIPASTARTVARTRIRFIVLWLFMFINNL